MPDGFRDGEEGLDDFGIELPARPADNLVAGGGEWLRRAVIIGGATGSGKTTTLAALVNEINQRDARHIVTIEDPIDISTLGLVALSTWKSRGSI